MAGETGRRISMREALRRKATKTKFENLPEREGRYLRVEKGKRPDIRARKMARALTTAVTRYSRGKFIYFLNGFQEKDAQEIKEFVAQNEGVTGFAFESRGESVHYNVKRNVSLHVNRVGAQEQLGPAYSSAIGEELLLRIRVPTGRPSELGPVTAEKILMLARAGISAVFSEDEMDQNVRAGLALTIDENYVHDLVERGLVKDPEEIGIATESFAIEPRVVKSITAAQE
jgi:hypothetical protein